jgi:hypothetical protein
MMSIPRKLDDEWVEFLDWFGSGVGITVPTPRRLLLQVQPIIRAYMRNPRRRGLLLLLGAYALGGKKIQIPEEVITSARLNDSQSRLAANLIRISQANWTQQEASKIARAIVEHANEHPWLIDRIAWILETEEVKPEEQELFFVALRDILAARGGKALTGVYRALNKVMRSRTSQLNKRRKWSELGLPPLP